MFLNSDCVWYGDKSIFSLCFDSANHETEVSSQETDKGI